MGARSRPPACVRMPSNRVAQQSVASLQPWLLVWGRASAWRTNELPEKRRASSLTSHDNQGTCAFKHGRAHDALDRRSRRSLGGRGPAAGEVDEPSPRSEDPEGPSPGFVDRRERPREGDVHVAGHVLDPPGDHDGVRQTQTPRPRAPGTPPAGGGARSAASGHGGARWRRPRPAARLPNPDRRPRRRPRRWGPLAGCPGCGAPVSGPRPIERSLRAAPPGPRGAPRTGGVGTAVGGPGSTPRSPACARRASSSLIDVSRETTP